MIDEFAQRLAASGKYSYITLRRSWTTATGRVAASGIIPDIIAVGRNGVVDAWEVQSVTDVESELRQRLETGLGALPTQNRGSVHVIDPSNQL